MKDCPIRVLHVVGGLDRGGIETFLMHVLRRCRRVEIQMDFVSHQPGGGAYEAEVLAAGSRLFRCPFSTRPPKYAREFRRILQEHGPFDIMHSHVHHYSGFVLRLAHEAGVPVRITHSHNDTSAVDTRAGFARRLYLQHMDRLMRRHATLGLACSEMAASSLFGADWQRDSKWKLLPYGIDLTPFHEYSDRDALRAELGIAPDALLAIHVGRFDPQKNHPFLIRIAEEIAKREPAFRLLLLGKGSLQPAIEEQVKECGLEGSVIFGGSRPDVPQCLKAADVFVMPSLHEGFGLACLEAQAAGVPAIVADTFPPEVAVVESLVQFLSLDQTPEQWAGVVLKAARAPKPIAPEQALAVVEESPYNIVHSVARLERIYRDAISSVNG